MAANYPTFRDVFRRIHAPVDEVHAQLLRDMFTVVVAIMTELGPKPSGTFGSIFGRMFGNEMVSRTCGYWRKIHMQILDANSSNLAGSPDFTTLAYWPDQRMKGVETVNGNDTPFVFAIYQGTPGRSLVTERNNTTFVGRYPWRIYNFHTTSSSVNLAGADILGGDPSGTNTPLRIGIVAWGLPSPSPENQP